MTHDSPARPVVVVLGGGYAGVQVARPLDDLADVVLVEPKDHFVHNVAALRALVDPSWLERIYLPYSGLLGAGRVIRTGRSRPTPTGWCSPRAPNSSRTTSSWPPGPATRSRPNPILPGTGAAHGKVRSTHAALAAADRVLLLGAGPVGIELAGEIKAVWPGKQVTLVDVAGDVLGERYRPDLKAELRRQLTGLGAELLLGSPLRAGPPTAAGELGTFTVTTEAGAEVTADIWFRCFGVTPASDYLAGGLAAARRPDGFVEVTPELLVAGQDQVFALGDVSAADQNKGAGAAGRQAPVVAGNIRALITGTASWRATSRRPASIIVPIGPDGGAGQRAGIEDLLPAETVAELKGRDMMVGRFAELLGLST
jgi:NADH dehydrogenase FAD-containing subunit